VLVADDDPDILLLITVTLERDGYDVVTAKDGLSALEAAVERVPHLVVLDLMMPGLDGYGVTRRLRSEQVTKDVAEEHQAARALEAGADAYMKKPFSPRELLTRTAALILERRPRSRLAGA
jgi:DNA-binding response OmpR family regulator